MVMTEISAVKEVAKAINGEVQSEKEYALIQELIKVRQETNRELEYEHFDGYEMPPRTQFSMLKKPAVSIKYGKLTFNMAAIHLFEGIKNVLPMVNRQKKRLAIVPCTEEESASVEWARQKGDIWVNKQVTSLDFVETIFQIMEWNRECRYKVLGRLVNSDRGLILVFDLEEFIMFGPKKEEYVDPATGETKKRQVKYYPDFYKNRIGRYYNDYIVMHQMSLFEDTESYSDGSDLAAKPVSVDEPAMASGNSSTFSNNAGQKAGAAAAEPRESLSEEDSSSGSAIEKLIV